MTFFWPDLQLHIHNSVNELTLRKTKCTLHIMTMKDRLFAGGHVNKHMCKTAFLQLFMGNKCVAYKYIRYVHITDNTCVYIL